MNVPAIAKKSFDELSKEPLYTGIVQKVLKKLKKLSNYLKRARFIHRLIDEYNQEIFSHSVVKKLSPCSKGCSACCHTQVSVTEDEAQLLVQKIREGIAVDRERMRKQMQSGDDAAEFYKLSFEDRKCLFLGSDGACRIYSDRPSVCRTNAVIGEASQCDTSSSIQPLRLVKTPRSDMVIYASFLFSKRNGSLPVLVGTLLQESESQP